MLGKFTVPRDKWRKNILCDRDGLKCVWGHYLCQSGISEDAITLTASLEEVKNIDKTKLPSWCYNVWYTYEDDKQEEKLSFTDDAEIIICTNDSENDSDSLREQNLIELFAKQDITLEFVD